MRYSRRSPRSSGPPPRRWAARGGSVSYEIDVASVRAVLLADGWHRVKASSFGIEPYGYVAQAPAPEAPEGKAEGKAKGNGGGGKKKQAAAATVAHVAEKGLVPVLGARWTKPNGE